MIRMVEPDISELFENYKKFINVGLFHSLGNRKQIQQHQVVQYLGETYLEV